MPVQACGKELSYDAIIEATTRKEIAGVEELLIKKGTDVLNVWT
jgi:hypothetical protein